MMDDSPFGKDLDGYYASCNRLAERFCAYHGFRNDGWVGNDVGGWLYADSFIVSIDEIVADLSLSVSNGDFFSYIVYRENNRYSMNYRNWLKLYRNDRRIED